MELLKEYIGLLLEATKTPSDAVSEGLALMVSNRPGGDITLVLYDAGLLAEVITEMIRDLESQGERADLRELHHFEWLGDVPDLIIGLLGAAANRSGQCNDAYEITTSVALRGYGPMLYDAMMSTVPGNTLTPDRHAVSDDASAVWKYYRDNRSDVETTKLDNVKDPQTLPKKDDCKLHKSYDDDHWLDQSYSSDGIDVSGLVSAHDNVLKDISDEIHTYLDLKINPKKLEHALKLFGFRLFDQKHNQG